MGGISLAAERNFAELSENRYSGRGIVMGMSDDGRNAVQVYWIMGRSENSRNRVLSYNGHKLFTEAADPAKVKKDPSLIIYNAMKDNKLFHIVSNGHQTDQVTSILPSNNGDLKAALHG